MSLAINNAENVLINVLTALTDLIIAFNACKDHIINFGLMDFVYIYAIKVKLI